MSKDSSPTYIHLHQPRLADVFEDFNRPHTSLTNTSSSTGTAGPNTAPSGSGPGAPAGGGGPSVNGAPAVPSFLPIEDIYVAPQFQPVNPEDEDDVVPDQHAAFGITRAMDARRETVWRDLGLEELMRGIRLGVGSERENRRVETAGKRAEWGRLGRKATCLR